MALGVFATMSAATVANQATRPWMFAVVLSPLLVFLIAYPLILRRAPSKVRPIPDSAEYSRLGVAPGHGLRFVGGLSASATDVTKRCTYPFGEMLVDERHVVLRIRGWPGTKITIPLLRSGVVRVTCGRGPLGIGSITFDTIAGQTGRTPCLSG